VAIGGLGNPVMTALAAFKVFFNQLEFSMSIPTPYGKMVSQVSVFTVAVLKYIFKYLRDFEVKTLKSHQRLYRK
jgi:hypothetical protein